MELNGLSPYKIKKKQLLDEYAVLLQAVEEVGIGECVRAKLDAKLEKTDQDMKKLDEENPEEVRAFQAYVAEMTERRDCGSEENGRNEDKCLNSGESLLGPNSVAIGQREIPEMNSSLFESTPPLRRLQRMLAEAKLRFGDFEGGERPERGEEKFPIVPIRGNVEDERGIHVGPKSEGNLLGVELDSDGILGARNAPEKEIAHITENKGKNVNFSQKNKMSWKDVLSGKKYAAIDGKNEDGERVLDINGIGTGNSKCDRSDSNVYCNRTEAAPRPGARSKIQLSYFAFKPGTPVDNLVTDAGTVERLNNCIVGHFLGARMDFYDVRREMFKQWECCGLEKMWCTENGIYLFKFRGTNKIDEILEEAHCHIFGKVMVLKRWHHMQKLSKEAILKVPIWVKLYELPFEFWLGDSVGENLSKIASRIGRPMYTDIATEKGMRLSFARVCVEIDVTDVLPSSVSIEYGGERVDIRVEYQWVPPKCVKCGAFGHRETYCPLSPSQSNKPTSESKSSKYEYGSRTNGKGKTVIDLNWRVIRKTSGESKRDNSNDTHEEVIGQDKNKEVLRSEELGKKAQVKGKLAKDKGYLKSGNSFAVLQSIQGENQGINLHRVRKETGAIGAPRVKKTEGDDGAGGVGRDILGDMSIRTQDPEEDMILFDAFGVGKEAEGLGLVTPKTKKVWTENDFPIDWGNSKRRKAAKAANLAGPVHIDPP